MSVQQQATRPEPSAAAKIPNISRKGAKVAKVENFEIRIFETNLNKGTRFQTSSFGICIFVFRILLLPALL
jgi:hypothetical protein